MIEVRAGQKGIPKNLQGNKTKKSEFHHKFNPNYQIREQIKLDE